jgi:purine-binding chemotaxis protein CheW
MITEFTAGDSLSGPVSHAKRKAGFDWASLRRRLDASAAALQQRLTPGAEEKRKILRARARARSLAAAGKAEAASPRQFLEVVPFVLGCEYYAIEADYIREILPLSEFTPLPCTPSFVLGLANVRGQILSIINIKKLFDLPEKGLTNLNKLIIVHGNHMELGILADDILGVRSILLEELRSALPTLTGIREKYLKGITKDPLVVLDMDNIFSDERILVNDGVEARV